MVRAVLMEWSWRGERSPADLMMAQLGTALVRFNISLCLYMYCRVISLCLAQSGSSTAGGREAQEGTQNQPDGAVVLVHYVDGWEYYHPPRSRVKKINNVKSRVFKESN